MEDFLSGPKVKIKPFNAGGAVKIPGQGARAHVPHNQKKKKKNTNQNPKHKNQKQHYNRFNNYFLKMVQIKK